MPIFSEFIPYWREVLGIQKQHEILVKIKKTAQYTPKLREGASGSAKILDLKLNEDGTLSTYLEKEKYPVKAYPDIETVWFTAYYKRFIPLIAESLIKMGWTKRIITILALKYNLIVAKKWFHQMFQMKPYLLKDEHWCKPIKELRRVLNGRMEDEFKDAIALAIEYDSAYKWVVQDIVPLLDKNLFRENPYKEIKRLFDIFISRNEGAYEKWNSMYKFLLLYLRMNRKLLKTIKEIIEDLKIEEFIPSKEDHYWMLYYNAYNCFGMNHEERMKEYLLLKNS